MWIETSAEVYSVILAKHKKQMSVHSSFSDPTGTGHSFSTGKPEMITEWGFKISGSPILKAHSNKETEEQTDWDTKYFISYTPQ